MTVFPYCQIKNDKVRLELFMGVTIVDHNNGNCNENENAETNVNGKSSGTKCESPGEGIHNNECCLKNVVSHL